MFEMLGLVLRKTGEEYSSNLKVAVSYLLLLVFVFLFVLLDGFYIASGTIFLGYGVTFSVIVGLAVGIAFLYFLSFFVSLTIYAVRRDIQYMSLDDYLNELMRGSSFKIFLLYLTAAAAFYLVWILGSYFGIGVGAIAAIDFIIAFALMYAPQSIVLDEETIQGSIADSVNFIFSQPILAVATILIGSMILALVFAFESLLDSFALPGAFVTLVLVLVFVLPLIEQMKSYSFIMKFDLLRSVEYYQSQARPSLPQVINAVRLRERRPGGKL